MTGEPNQFDERTVTRAQRDTDPDVQLGLIFNQRLPQYCGEHSPGELANFLDEIGDTLEEHGTLPGRPGPGRAWEQITSLVRDALDMGADPDACRALPRRSATRLRNRESSTTNPVGEIR